MKKTLCILVLCTLVFSGLWADVEPEFTGWKQADTRHFRFVYEDSSKFMAEAYAEIADEAYEAIARVYGLPQDRLTVYVVGRTNTVNAKTVMPPLSLIMYTTPFVVPDFTYRDDWVKFVFTHELIHAANMNFESRSLDVAELFGDYFHLMDVQNMNGWEVEGLTTVLETELSAAGRGRSPYFEMLYKAPAMENSMIPYNEIGTSPEAPTNQIYVYGYLMMRSIADRWGLHALADLERNRGEMESYETAVVSVTGETGEEIWRDVKIALTKKYAQERSIPEGKIVSPRDDYYYKPAVILDDGTMITLRGTGQNAKSVVLINPTLRAGEVAYDELNGNDAAVRETILFHAEVPDIYSVTADASGKVYAALANKRSDRAPSVETEYQIYTWDKENGLNQLTSGSSYFQPSVSRDGSTLVALEQKGRRMRLVQIDVSTGAVTPLLEDPAYDFGMPAISDDGSRVALLRIGGGRGAVAMFDIIKAASGVCDASALTIVANGSGDIVDPAYPGWNTDGKLTYCCNTRGRLEVFEVNREADGSFSSTPVVSDPVAALWAYRTDRGIYYGSFTGSGYAIKMKPLREWGVVPDWNGPSMPGEKVIPGSRDSDYWGFKPYEDVNYELESRIVNKYVNDETLGEPVKVLQNEKKHVFLPSTLMQLPLVTVTSLPDDETAFGLGAFWMGTTTQVPGRMKVVEADAEFYPEIMNFSGNAGFETEINNSVLDLFFSRQLATYDSGFNENNMFIAGYSKQFYSRSTPVSVFELSSLTMGTGSLIRCDDKAFAVNADLPWKHALSAAAGFGLYREKWNPTLSFGSILTSTAVALCNWDDTLSKLYYGAEADVGLRYGDGEWFAGVYMQGRYLDAPSSLTIGNSTMKHGGSHVDCTNPFNLLARLEGVYDMGGMDMIFYEEGMCSCTKAGNFKLDDILASGFELSMPLGSNSIASGFTTNYSLSKNEFNFGGFYFTLKMNFIRM